MNEGGSKVSGRSIGMNQTALQYKGTFVNDKPVGQFWYYYPTSEVRAIIEHISENQSL